MSYTKYFSNLDKWCTLPTLSGNFRMYDTGSEDFRIVSFGGLHELAETPLLRIHSSCLASEVFGALDCDCAEQLAESLKLIANEGSGLIIHLHQEGRGQGLSKKIQAVSAMQREDLDTVEAFEKLGLEQDTRNYQNAVELLEFLGITCVRLITNNPAKIRFLEDCDITVKMVNTHPNVRLENAEYLRTKNAKLNHHLPLNDIENSSEPILFYHSDQPWGEFSNFSRHAVHLNGKIWPTVEHYYQAQKFANTVYEEEVRLTATPTLAKQLAATLIQEHALCEWDSPQKELTMIKGLRAKFSQHPDLNELLLKTGDRLIVESTNKDPYWGHAANGSGLNRLGHILMQIRGEIRYTDKSR